MMHLELLKPFWFRCRCIFLGYFIAEVPSNILLHRFGARIWIARIMITWGIIAALMGFIHSGTQFIVLRFYSVLQKQVSFRCYFYLTLWFPAKYRARVLPRSILDYQLLKLLERQFQLALCNGAIPLAMKAGV